MRSSASLQHTILATSIFSMDNIQKPTLTNTGPSEKDNQKQTNKNVSSMIFTLNKNGLKDDRFRSKHFLLPRSVFYCEKVGDVPL